VLEIGDGRGGGAFASSGVGWARFVTTGGLGTVRATGYVELRGQKVSGIRFYDPATAQQSNLYASDLPVADAHPTMVLKNTSATALIAAARFLPAGGDSAAAVELPGVALDAGAAVMLDLAPLVRMAAGRPDLARVSVVVESTSGPGSLIGGLSAIRQSGMVSDIPLRDSGTIRQSTGTYPWRLDEDYNTVVSITNVTGVPARFHVQVKFSDGEYTPRSLEIAPHATAYFDLRHLRDNRVPDRKGRTLPPEVTSGQFHWSILSSGGQTKLNGRADISSVAAGRSTSYSCPDCCPDSFGWAFLDPWSTTVAGGGIGDFWILAKYRNCYQQYYDVEANSLSASWVIEVPPVTSIENVWYGLGRAHGNETGDSSIWGSWDEEVWNFAADYCWVETTEASASGQISVPCAVPMNFQQTSVDKPTGALQFHYAWDSSTGLPSHLSECAIEEVINFTPNPWPSPPFPANLPGGPNPRIQIMANGSAGSFPDLHSAPGPFVTPYTAATVNGAQSYTYRCPCANGGNRVTMASYTIVRTVSQNPNGSWKYTITKNSQSNTIDPIQ
jgi:hypothetical protein